MVKRSWRNKKTAVIGLGREGIELVRFLSKQGAEVTVLDRSSAGKLGTYYREAKKLGAKFQLGSAYLSRLTDFDTVFRSPGVPLTTLEIKKAIRAGVEISSTIKLFFELSPAKIIAVTGTKGKSTTTSLIYHLFKGNKKSKMYLAGNIGASPLPLLGKLKAGDMVALELSSFQLEDMVRSPQIAVLLDVVPEHLDRHKTFAKYLAAKQNIYLHQKKSDWLIASRDFEPTRTALKSARGRTLPISTRQILRKGVYLSKGEIIYRHWRTGRRQMITNISGLKLIGEHNLQNLLPAVAVAMVVNLPIKTIAQKLRSFKPLKHRLELVRRVNNVSFINDSLGTTPEAATAAILAFPKLPKAIIVGGVYKGGNIGGLVQAAASGNVRQVILIGSSAGKFLAVFKKSSPNLPIQSAKNLLSAVKLGMVAVKTGGAVMLTPACASFDMFKDAYDRGEQFRKIVNQIKE